MSLKLNYKFQKIYIHANDKKLDWFGKVKLYPKNLIFPLKFLRSLWLQ